MTNLIQKLARAQEKAMEILPDTNHFPVLAEVLRQHGVISNSWFLPSCQSIYQFDNDSIVQIGVPLINNSQVIPYFDQDALIAAIRNDQRGCTTFPEFLQATWESGVISYTVDFVARTVTYYGCKGETYIENYQSVKLSLD